MDSRNPPNPAKDVATPVEPGETFVGTIRWIALAIGVACLALLTLVGSIAHAAGTSPAAAPLQRHEATAWRIATPTGAHSMRGAETPLGNDATIELR